VTAAERAIDPQVRIQDALDKAYRYLGRRDRTVVEVRRHLEGKRVEPDAIEAAVRELCEQGYLDDARYAVRFAEDRRSLDGWGTDRIALGLGRAGVPPEHAEAALAQQDGAAELEAAIAVLERRLRTPPADERSRSRALGLLTRRGYSLELSYEAIRAYEAIAQTPGHG